MAGARSPPTAPRWRRFTWPVAKPTNTPRCASRRPANRSRRWSTSSSIASAVEPGRCMRYLVLTDIHGNIDALDAVLAGAGDVDAHLLLGDVVGYGAGP